MISIVGAKHTPAYSHLWRCLDDVARMQRHGSMLGLRPGTDMAQMVYYNFLFPTKTKGKQAGCETVRLWKDSERAGLLYKH